MQLANSSGINYRQYMLLCINQLYITINIFTIGLVLGCAITLLANSHIS